MINGHPSNQYAEATQQMVDYLRGDPPRFFPASNLGFGRKQFTQLGGFPSGYPLAAGEDRAFCDRAGQLVFCPAAQVIHRHNLTLRRYWRQHVNYGRGAAILRQSRRRQGRRHLATPSFYLNLLAHPMRQRGLRAAPQSALLLLAQVATAYGMLRQRTIA